MKKVFFTLIFAIFFVCDAWANEDVSKYIEDCLAVIDKPNIKAKSSYGYLQYNFDKDEDFLRKKTSELYNERGLKLPDDHKVLGLTVVRLGFELDVGVGMISVSNDKYCLYPTDINAYIGYSAPIIYILKDLQKGSCKYDVALKHEKTHMEIYINALDYFLPKFKDTVENLLYKVGVKIIDKPKDDQSRLIVAKKFSEVYHNYVKKQVDEWWNILSVEQGKLDTMENYDLENRICREIDKK